MAIQTDMLKIYVAGHRGMVGSAIVRQLLARGHKPEQIVGRTHAELDLTDQAAVRAFFAAEKPARSLFWTAPCGCGDKCTSWRSFAALETNCKTMRRSLCGF